MKHVDLEKTQNRSAHITVIIWTTVWHYHRDPWQRLWWCLLTSIKRSVNKQKKQSAQKSLLRPLHSENSKIRPQRRQFSVPKVENKRLMKEEVILPSRTGDFAATTGGCFFAFSSAAPILVATSSTNTDSCPAHATMFYNNNKTCATRHVCHRIDFIIEMTTNGSRPRTLCHLLACAINVCIEKDKLTRHTLYCSVNSCGYITIIKTKDALPRNSPS